MRDYAELINRLRRSCAILVDGGKCEDCAGSRCMEIDAADAIEELLKEVQSLENDCINLTGECATYYAQIPKWISVEERLPSRYETVLLNIQTCKDSYVTIGDYEPNELRFRDFADRNNQVYCGDIVTHWMPLPAPPKGVE